MYYIAYKINIQLYRMAKITDGGVPFPKSVNLCGTSYCC